MSNLNIINIEMESCEIVSDFQFSKIKKLVNFKDISKILVEHYPSDYCFNYDMFDFSDFTFSEAIETLRLNGPFTEIKSAITKSESGKLKIVIEGMEFKKNNDFEFCLVLAAIGIKIGGWTKQSWRNLALDDGEILSQCLFKYEIDGLIYHSRYVWTQAEITEDGVNYDTEELQEDISFLVNNEEEIELFFEFLKYNYIKNEIIIKLNKNTEKKTKLKFVAKIDGTDIDITWVINDQDKLKRAFERSKSIICRKIENEDTKWVFQET